jgi:ABC-type lipoprotein release transport system permease subunit
MNELKNNEYKIPDEYSLWNDINKKTFSNLYKRKGLKKFFIFIISFVILSAFFISLVFILKYKIGF